MRRSLTRAAMQQQSSQSLASALVMLSYMATRHTLFPLSHRPLLCPLLLPTRRHPKPRKRKSIDMYLLGNCAKHGAISCLPQIPSPTNRRGTGSREGVAGAASGLCSLSGTSSRCHWRAGSGDGDGGLRRWTPMLIMRMARRMRRTRMVKSISRCRCGRGYRRRDLAR